MRHILMAVALPLAGAALLGTIAPPSPAGALTRITHITHITRTTRRKRLPLVIGHRGASGHRPEHTLASYELAARMGADFIEPDLVSTSDGVLVARHEPEIGGTTDVAGHPEFAARRTTKQVDGHFVTGWFTTDFTLAELKTLRAKERLPLVRKENTMWDGHFEIPTFEEVLTLRESLSRELHRTIGIYPETKHPTFFRELGLALEPKIVAGLRAHGLDHPSAPVFVQSFELTNLYTLREALKVTAPLVFLTGGGAPYDLLAQGDPRTYADLQRPASLAVLARTIDGLGPDKALVIPRCADGTLSDTPTSLVDHAHAVGLVVHPYTFRAENTFLPNDHRVGSDPTACGRAVEEQLRFLRTGIDGLFTDQVDIGVAARSAWVDSL